jgi:D-glycero-D-manno-heptose 1,7-bisphosphate phosphatase
MTSRFTVFLDRDGVINRKLPKGRFVCRWDEFEFLPHVPKSIRLLKKNKLTTILVTNQRGVSLGLYTEGELLKLHRRMSAALRRHRAPLDGIYYCPHAAGVCDCRKPGIGLFRQAFLDFPDTDPTRSVVVGDSISDMQAAHHLGCEKVLIDDGAGTVAAEAQKCGIQIEYCADSLLVAVQRYILPRYSMLLSA